MGDKPVLWMPRRLSEATIARARRDYDLILNEADTPGTADEIIAMSARVDAMIPCHSEHFTADVVDKLDPRLKIIANHSVDYSGQFPKQSYDFDDSIRGNDNGMLDVGDLVLVRLPDELPEEPDAVLALAALATSATSATTAFFCSILSAIAYLLEPPARLFGHSTRHQW